MQPEKSRQECVLSAFLIWDALYGQNKHTLERLWKCNHLFCAESANYAHT